MNHYSKPIKDFPSKNEKKKKHLVMKWFHSAQSKILFIKLYIEIAFCFSYWKMY